MLTTQSDIDFLFSFLDYGHNNNQPLLKQHHLPHKINILLKGDSFCYYHRGCKVYFTASVKHNGKLYRSNFFAMNTTKRSHRY